VGQLSFPRCLTSLGTKHMKHYRLLLTFALLNGSVLAQTMGFYAMVPVVRDEPYIAERVRMISPPDPSGSAAVEEIRSTVMRDSAGRLREQKEGTQPDQRGSFREARVRVLDPVSMLQTDLDVLRRTYHKGPIPEQVKRYQQRPATCTGPLSHPNSDGRITHIRYERLGRATVQGVPADGCRITTDDIKSSAPTPPTPGGLGARFQSVSDDLKHRAISAPPPVRRSDATRFYQHW